MKARYALTALVLSAPLAALACQQPQNDLLAEDVTASVQQQQMAAGMTRLISQPLDDSDAQSGEDAATEVESRGIAGLYPASCVTVTQTSLTTVHVEFDACTGPFGLIDLTGGVDADFRIEGGKLHASMSDSGDLSVQGSPVDYSAEAVLQYIGVESHIDWQGHWKGETPDGEAATHDSDMLIVADPFSGCVRLDGTATGAVEDRGIDWDVDGYAVCPLECPTAGLITATGKQSEGTVTIAFDGSAVAEVTDPEGRVWNVPLVCMAADGQG